MQVQINIWLLLLGGLQALLLSLVLVKKKTYRYGYGFLIAYLLVITAQILFKVLDKQWLIEGMTNTYFLSYKFPLLYGPLVFLFTKHLTQPSKSFSPIDTLHFLPFLYSVLVINLVDGRGMFSFFYFALRGIPGLFLQVGSLLCYHLLSLKLWKQHNTKVKDFFSDLHIFKTQWIRKFIFYSLFICLAISILSYFIYVWYPAYNWLRFGFLFLCFFIYWISYSALHQPGLFIRSVNKEIYLHPLHAIPVLPTMVIHRPAKKYAHSTLTNEEAARIVAELASLMCKQKLFAEPELTIEQLAAKLHTSRYVLSQVLNERLKQFFYEYINGCRVEAAKEMLADAAFNNHKIAAIGYEAGFNSLSAFNEVFKKITALTPSQYKKQSAEDQWKQRV